MTFSLLASSRDGLYLAAATASFSLAVGNAVPAVAGGVGAVASQAWTNRTLRHFGLGLLRDGATPEDALLRLAHLDAGWNRRQVALLSPNGQGAAHTGEACTPWAGARTGAGFVAAGNLLTGPEVLDAIADAMRTDGIRTDGPTGGNDGEGPLDFARRILQAMAAGQRAGGDSRGQQSAAVVVAANAAADLCPPELVIDLRVDDHAEPLAELDRLLAIWHTGQLESAIAPAG